MRDLSQPKKSIHGGSAACPRARHHVCTELGPVRIGFPPDLPFAPIQGIPEGTRITALRRPASKQLAYGFPGNHAVDMAISGLEDHLGFWLRFVSNQVSASFQRRVAALGVTVSEWVALRTLCERGELSPMTLVDALGMTKGAISKLVARLEVAGLLCRESDEHDGRAQRISLTAAGRTLVRQLARAADDNDEEFFGHLGEREQAQLKKMMTDLVRTHGWREIPVD
jgi:DNA-binding MarR family transcriptional regulator